MTKALSLIEQVVQLRLEVEAMRELIQQTRNLVGPMGLPMPDGSMLTQTLHGLLYYIDPTDTIIAPQMLIYRQWEADLTRLINALLEDATTFVDVGANFGYFSCLAAKRLADKPQASVIAVEPNPHLIKLLKRNAEINWSLAPIKVIEAAAGEAAGPVTLFIPAEHGANGGLTNVDQALQVKVDMIRLDDIISPGLTVDVMKVDVEGHELGVLKGAADIIQRSPDIKIIVEWSPNQMRDAGVKVEEFKSFMIEKGLSPFKCSKTSIEPISWENLISSGYDNILFSRQFSK
jgi:FkbM family methyltransferase